MSEDQARAPRHVEDLSALSRRGALSANDEQALASALDASATLATAHQLGLDFDRVAAVKSGDEALIAEVAARVMSRGRPASFARFRLRALLLAASLTLAGSATALWKLTRTPAVSTRAAASASGRADGGAARPAKLGDLPSRPRAEPDTAPSGLAPPMMVARPSVSASRASSARAEARSVRIFDSAELLFREANSARRSGDAAGARALYLRLEQDFPASDEAHLAHVSLGNLLLTMDRPGEAERQFASYLGGRPALAQEASVGRAQSLAALGRRVEEQHVWEELVRDYPNSVYAGRAKQRLTELARTAAPPE